MSSAHDISEGGAAVALAECLFGTDGLGAEVTLAGDKTTALFSETQSRFILSVKKEHQAAFEELVKDAQLIGEVTDSGELVVLNENKELLIKSDSRAMEGAWKGAIPSLLKK